MAPARRTRGFGYRPSTFPAAQVYRHDGRVHYFKRIGTNYVADADVDLRLTRDYDVNGTWSGWTLINQQDQTERYGIDGIIQSITNRKGISHTFALTPAGFLIRHSFGQELLFTSDFELIVPGGARYTFAYDSLKNLTSITYPDQSVQQFRYANTSYRRALTSLIDEAGVTYASYAYDASGKAISTQLAGGAVKYTVSYTSASRTTVTEPALGTRTYDHAVVLGMHKPTATSLGCASCTRTDKITTYDPNGNVQSRLDFNDIETRYSHDAARNLELSRTEAYGAVHARAISTQWHPRYRLRVESASSLRRVP